MTKTSPEPADEGDTEMQQPVGDRAGIHDIGGHDEQRHCQKQEPVEQPLDHGFTGDGNVLARNTQIDNHADDDGVGDRRADGGRAEQGKKAEDQLHAHDASSRSSSPAAGAPVPSSSAVAVLASMKPRHR